MNKRFKIDPSNYTLQGKAGEMAVAAQLLMRGVMPYLPVADMGVDLLIESGCRVQVKSSHLLTTQQTRRRYLEGAYRFSINNKRYRATSLRGVVKTVRYVPKRRIEETCDIVVFWGIEQNRFWIVPSSLLKGIQCLDLGPDNNRRFHKDVPQMREMANLGYTQEEIGKHFGVGGSTICIRLQRADIKTHLDSAISKIRACENAWHHILDFGQPTAISDMQIPEPERSLIEEA